MNLTPKGLKKPSTTDAYDIEIQNSNMDMIDELIDDKVDKVEGKGLSANDYTLEEKIKLGGISKQATKVEASGINGNIKIDGLQAKVYDDSEISNRVGPLANLLTTIKTSIVNAINSLKGEVDEHKAEYVQLEENIDNHFNSKTPHKEVMTMQRSGKDSNGVFTIIDFKRVNGTLFKKSTLSGGASPKYTTRTVKFYDNDGITVLETIVYALTYTGDDLTSEVIQ